MQSNIQLSYLKLFLSINLLICVKNPICACSQVPSLVTLATQACVKHGKHLAIEKHSVPAETIHLLKNELLAQSGFKDWIESHFAQQTIVPHERIYCKEAVSSVAIDDQDHKLAYSTAHYLKFYPDNLEVPCIGNLAHGIYFNEQDKKFYGIDQFHIIEYDPNSSSSFKSDKLQHHHHMTICNQYENSNITATAYNASKQLFALCTDSSFILLIWMTASKIYYIPVSLEHNCSINSASFSANGSSFMAVTDQGKIYFYSILYQQHNPEIQLSLFKSVCFNKREFVAVMHPIKDAFAIALKKITLIHIKTQDKSLILQTSQEDHYDGLQFNKSGNLLAAAGASGKIYIISMEKRACIRQLDSHNDTITSMQFLRGDNVLVSGSKDTTIAFHNLSFNLGSTLSFKQVLLLETIYNTLQNHKLLTLTSRQIDTIDSLPHQIKSLVTKEMEQHPLLFERSLSL